MTPSRESVKMIHAALDEDTKGNIILRGVISPESLYLLKVAPYQREILPSSKISDLVEAFDSDGAVPDVELGMRGGSFLEKEGAFYLHDDTFIVDGLQRRTAAIKCLEAGKEPRLGASVHFNTDEKWERERFKILNTTNTKLSPNVLLRNMQTQYNIVELLNTISKDKSFVLSGKICWNQRMTREELITALGFLKVAAQLHTKFGATRSNTRIDDIVPAMEKLYTKLGRGTVRENIKMFWNVMDECFKIHYVTFKEGAVALKGGFLLTMATIFSDHSDFWKDSKLSVPRDLVKKIASFPTNDPEIVRLAGARGAAQEILYQLMVSHINSGKRTKRLTPARPAVKSNKKEVEEQKEGNAA